MQLLLVFICQLEGCKAVFVLVDVVGLDDRCEDREAILDIESRIIAVCVHTCTLSRSVIKKAFDICRSWTSQMHGRYNAIEREALAISGQGQHMYDMHQDICFTCRSSVLQLGWVSEKRLTNNGDFLAGPGLIDEVMQEDDVLVARQTAGLH